MFRLPTFAVRSCFLVLCLACLSPPALHAQELDDNFNFRGTLDTRSLMGGNGSVDGGMQNLTGQLGGALRPPVLTAPGGNPQASPAPRRPGRSAIPNSAATLDDDLAPSQATGLRPAPASNPFQEFVQASTGKSLPMFGYELFQNAPSTFAPLQNVPVTQDYAVGPGDELLVRAWGQVEFDLRLTVDRDGMVSIPRVGMVSVAGMKFQELPAHLKATVGRLYRNFEMTVSMGQLRSIQVYVVGQARRPGVYTLSSLSTLVNAVFAAGGPSGKGSMRHVQLKRADKVVAEFDLYELLARGDKSRDVALMPSDVIFFPNIGPLVAVTGSVNTPAVFELKDGATRISELVAWAGGFSTLAASQAATLERLENRTLRRVDDFSIDAAGLAREARDGDIITFRAISPRFDNLVVLKGFVAWPGRYPFKPGMRVRDVLPDADALMSPEFWNKRNATALALPSVAGSPTAPAAGPAGPAAAPPATPRGNEPAPPSTFKNDVMRSEEINWDYAVIERMKDDRSATLVPFNLRRALVDADPSHNLLLAPGDIITVFSKDDIRVPQDKRRRFITLEGEFAVPGIYEVQPGETLRHLVSRIGGFGRGAYLFGSTFTRESVRVEQQQRLQDAVERMEKDFQRSAMQRAQAAVTKEQADSLQSELGSQREFVAKLKQVKAQGRIVLELPREDAQLRDLPELEIEDGDRFYVPPMPSTVSVFGAVFNENSFIYRREKRLGDYLHQAGGPTRNADSGSLYLLRADGSVASKRQDSWVFGGLEGEPIMPGDAVVVPETLERFNFTREAKAWTEIFYQFALGVAGLRVLQNGVK